MRVRYRGRFAPTPSGPLHMGSLLTAVASFVHAKNRQGLWLLRIDDLDTARNVEHADSTIQQQLEAHGLQWDEHPRYQSRFIADYHDALSALSRKHLLYACTCTRAQLKRASKPGRDESIYAGTCRQRAIESRPHAIRLRIRSGVLCFDDGWQGRQCRDMEKEIGDFVLQRADGLLAYQLACAVDESEQGITEVVRGADLLPSSFRQIYVQQALGLTPPAYRHLPVLVDHTGNKLSKQNHALAIESRDASRNLWHCLQLLGQQVSAELLSENPTAILSWAITHWQAAYVPKKLNVALE